MACIKTAVSIEESVFREAENLSRRLKVSRSQFFTRAVSEYVRQCQAEDVTRRLNEVYLVPPSEEEKRILAAYKRKARKLAEGRW